MSDGLYAAVAGAVAQGQAYETVSNNLANISSHGFKGDRVSFKEVLASNNGQTNVELRQVAVDKIVPDFNQGPVRTTGAPLDAAIEGDGFFVVATPNGERLTRNGAFTLTSDGQLISPDGLPVLGNTGPVQVRGDRPARIDARGNVWDGDVIANQLRIATVADRTTLSREGASLWRPNNPQALVPVEPRVVAGALEQSNISAVQGMTEIVLLSRAYESFHQVIEIFRNADQKTSNDLGK